MELKMVRTGSLFMGFRPYQIENYCGDWRVIQVDKQDLEFAREGFGRFVYKPLRLNDYWMGRLGFELQGAYYTVPGLRVLKDSGELTGLCQDHPVLEYVHELQNLYLKNNGKELPLPSGIVEQRTQKDPINKEPINQSS